MQIPVKRAPIETRIIPVQIINQHKKMLPIVLGEGIDKHNEQRFVQAVYEPHEFARRDEQFRGASIEMR